MCKKRQRPRAPAPATRVYYIYISYHDTFYDSFSKVSLEKTWLVLAKGFGA